MVCGDRRIALAELYAAGTRAGHRFERQAQGLPVAAHRRLQRARRPRRRAPRDGRDRDPCRAFTPPTSAGSINPMQCRGQVDGAIAMGFGWALYEKMVYDDRGADGESGAAQLPHPGLRRRAAHRGLLRRHVRHDRPARRQVAGRVRDQSGRARHRQRRGERDRRAVRQPAPVARAHLRPARGGPKPARVGRAGTRLSRWRGRWPRPRRSRAAWRRPRGLRRALGRRSPV